ncbi:hypothetical protein IT396_01910 [Candidatus Nomurabacteria bacterium]|nr:hypothetical protein [Candidatus Nomurabacteria bacterium]
MDKRTYYRLVSLIFTLLAVAHGARIWYGWPSVMGEYVIPMEVSWVAVGISGYLAVRGWQFANGQGGKLSFKRRR